MYPLAYDAIHLRVPNKYARPGSSNQPILPHPIDIKSCTLKGAFQDMCQSNRFSIAVKASQVYGLLQPLDCTKLLD